MFSKNNKSQAGFEFLTTYGWAFLVILIMISTLAYFGILTPSNVLPSRCNIGAEFQCIDHQISATGGTFRLRLKNGVGGAVTVSSIALSTESTTTYTCSLSQVDGVAATFPVTGWQAGDINDYLFTCSGGGLAAGTKGKVLVTVNYYTAASGASYTKQVKGDVFSSVV